MINEDDNTGTNSDLAGRFDELVMRLRSAADNFPVIDENPQQLLTEACNALIDAEEVLNAVAHIGVDWGWSDLLWLKLNKNKH